MDNIKQALSKRAAEFEKMTRELEQKQDDYWNSLTKEQQLMAFCAVSRRIYKGEIEDRGTYRYVLYDVFDFGPESYMLAQLAGYLAIHNSIFEAQEIERPLYTSGDQT